MINRREAKFARIWRGRVSKSRADEYEAYNYEVGVTPLIALAVGVVALREDDEKSIEEMREFTGGDPTKIHELPRDPEFLIDPPASLKILEVRHARGLGPNHS